MTSFHTIEWVEPGIVRMLDQRLLPNEEKYNEYTTYEEVAAAIKDMVIRGAPTIGAAAAYGMALVAANAGDKTQAKILEELKRAEEVLAAARPTAVNLFWALKRMKEALSGVEGEGVEAIKESLLAEANAIAADDVEINKSIARNAMPLVPKNATIMHHCNTGSLATVDYGTALGIIRMAHETGKNVFALVGETRPRLQGARLTAWELQQYSVPFKLIVDSASGHYIRTKGVDLCVVGADRVAANGDVANKIGTYNLAIVAHENNVPFYVAVPTSTIDMETAAGSLITIEERPAAEVTNVANWQITPDDTPVGNPAFDITPARYVTALITEKAVVYPPFEENLKVIMEA